MKPPKRAQECAKRANLGDFNKKNHRIGSGFSRSLGVNGLAEAGGGVRGGKLPEFGEFEFGLRCFERFAPVVNDGCGGLSSLRATAAPQLESDV